MSDDRRLNVLCPDCGCDQTVDRATGKVLFHKSAKQEAGSAKAGNAKDFDQLLAGLDESKQRADDIFQREVAAHQDRDRLMEEKFREAMRRAEEEPDPEPPLRPWELD